LLHWLVGLLNIRDSKKTAIQKTKLAIQLTAQSRVIWPLVKLMAKDLKRLGWDERGASARYGLLGGAVGLLVFGSQGAGIAALGTAIGVPLWIVLGAGAAFAAPLIEQLRERVSTSRPADVGDTQSVIDVDAKEVR
jgi:hypothetical protein